MCGIIGIVTQQPVNQLILDALTLLQHRGQDAAGIATCDGQYLRLRKGNGLAREVFSEKDMAYLTGNMGIGHVRYPTAGTPSVDEAQPFYVNSPYGISLVHNGNLSNAVSLKNELFVTDLRHINTLSDSEVLLNVLAHELQKEKEATPTADGIFRAVTRVFARCRGAYAVVAAIMPYGLVAFRDPNGIRPLVL
ncbi:MAG: amidophosphoribosyltransferase, partial [Pseudomonadota bacterium]